jgi:hypothetical protein
MSIYQSSKASSSFFLAFSSAAFGVALGALTYAFASKRRTSNLSASIDKALESVETLRSNLKEGGVIGKGDDHTEHVQSLTDEVAKAAERFEKAEKSFEKAKKELRLMKVSIEKIKNSRLMDSYFEEVEEKSTYKKGKIKSTMDENTLPKTKQSVHDQSPSPESDRVDIVPPPPVAASETPSQPPESKGEAKSKPVPMTNENSPPFEFEGLSTEILMSLAQTTVAPKPKIDDAKNKKKKKKIKKGTSALDASNKEEPRPAFVSPVPKENARDDPYVWNGVTSVGGEAASVDTPEIM